LRAAREFWSLSSSLDREAETGSGYEDFKIDDSDPFDVKLDGDELGILIRTDYSNEEAWNAFFRKIQQGEKEIQEMMADSDTKRDADVTDRDIEMGNSTEDNSDSDDSSTLYPLILKVINCDIPEEIDLFKDISNLTALRLLNDLDIRPSPTLLPGAKKIVNPHPLIDQDGLQEIYVGKNIWIYDSQSNIDECVRVVNQTGAFYGTATGDSWRARVSHVCEMQFNMTYFDMKVDFGGIDNWDYRERQRNLEEFRNG